MSEALTEAFSSVHDALWRRRMREFEENIWYDYEDEVAATIYELAGIRVRVRYYFGPGEDRHVTFDTANWSARLKKNQRMCAQAKAFSEVESVKGEEEAILTDLAAFQLALS